LKFFIKMQNFQRSPPLSSKMQIWTFGTKKMINLTDLKPLQLLKSTQMTVISERTRKLEYLLTCGRKWLLNTSVSSLTWLTVHKWNSKCVCWPTTLTSNGAASTTQCPTIFTRLWSESRKWLMKQIWTTFFIRQKKNWCKTGKSFINSSPIRWHFRKSIIF
jgi:hypothetical protein